MLKKLFMFVHKFHYKIFDLKAFYYSKIFKSCGKSFKLYGNVKIKNPENISFGNFVALNDGVYINAHAPITVGNNVAISAGAILVSTGLDSNTISEKFIHYEEDIVLHNNIQIGAGAIILSGVTIGSNVIVGAGSVVTKSIPNNVIVAGVPARIIRKLGKKKEVN